MTKYRIITTFDGKFIAQQYYDLAGWLNISIPHTREFAERTVKNWREKDNFVPEVVYQTPEAPKTSLWQKIKNLLKSL